MEFVPHVVRSRDFALALVRRENSIFHALNLFYALKLRKEHALKLRKELTKRTSREVLRQP